MASSSLKKTAQSNTKILHDLRTVVYPVVFLCLTIVWFFKRPSGLFRFIIFQVPAIGCELFLEKVGTPTYKKDPVDGYEKLVHSGENLNQPGLTEYLFDIIYYNLLLDILVIIFGSNKIWFLWLIVPGYVMFKVGGFVLPFITPYFTKAKREKLAPVEEKSKRQQKLEKKKTVRVR